MTSEDEIAACEREGYAARKNDEPLSKNPHSMAQGSPKRVLGIAWRRGWRQRDEEEKG